MLSYFRQSAELCVVVFLATDMLGFLVKEFETLIICVYPTRLSSTAAGHRCRHSLWNRNFIVKGHMFPRESKLHYAPGVNGSAISKGIFGNGQLGPRRGF